MTMQRVSFAAWLTIAIATGGAFAACSSSSDNKTAGGGAGGQAGLGGVGTGGRSGSGAGGRSVGGNTGGNATAGNAEGGAAGDGNAGDSAAGDSAAGAAGVSGDVPVTCATTGDAICDQLNQCAPSTLKAQYGDVATCKAAAEQACTATQIPSESGVNNPAACQAALVASCDSYFETTAHPPTACRQKAGRIAGGACGYSEQCIAGEGCDFSLAAQLDPACMQGTCAALIRHGLSCQENTDCDARTGDRCSPTFSAGQPGDNDETDICQAVTYGGLGADCATGSNKDCQVAFYCGPNNKCAALLGANATCDPAANNHCDSRFGLACRQVPQATVGTYACSAPTLVPSGAQCGLVNGTEQDCFGNLYCGNASAPSTCQPRVAQGLGCVSIPPNCAAGLHCAGASEANPGTCQPALAHVCQ
jgi:hypothetical protein